MNHELKILAIEDGALALQQLRSLLELALQQRYHLTVATSLADGLAHLHDHSPDLVFVDLTLPDATGIQAPRDVCAAAPHLPVIVLTGNRNEDLALKTLSLGAQDYLLKSHSSVDGIRRSIRHALARKRSQNEAARCRREADTARARLTRVREEFLGVAAHDLRAPVAAILWAVELLGVHHLGDLEAEVRPYLQIIQEQSQVLGVLAHTFLDTEALHDANDAPNFRPLDVDRFLDECVRDFGPVARMQKVDLQRTPVHVQLPVADGDRLRQVMANLISNAARHTPQGGRIVLSARQEKQHVIFTVTDSGGGVPAEVLEHLFDSPSPGGGLGLAICKRILETHGG
ncbi:hybrid sensor histidine kinase/response regulator, partial [bacterium AH-315-F18]|nr:hybrid sensor histidine kinase/response regulator [bacterium AH-315-F18]